MNWESILAQALTLVVVFDPIGNAPVVLGLLQKVAPERRRHILMREMLFVLALLLVIYFAGSTVLGMLGISRSSLTLTGGIMLFLIAIGLIFPSVNVMRQTGDDEVDAEPFIVPLVVPLIVGPAAISIIMLNSSLCTGFADRLAGILSLLLAWLIQSAVLLCSGSLLSRLGHKGIVSVTYADLHKELESGCRVLIDDGLIELTVDGIQGQDIACTVRSGGNTERPVSGLQPDGDFLDLSRSKGDAHFY